MSKLKLNTGKRYSVDLSGKVSLGNVPEMLLYDRLRDGRIIGLLIEDIIASEFEGVTRTQHNGSSCDLIHMSKKGVTRYQCKSFKGNSADLSPSYMKGKGRKFDPTLFVEYVVTIDAWLFVDISEFPKLEIFSVKSTDAINLMVMTDSGCKLRQSDILAITSK